ncbi:MAG: hypothetical protein EXS55_01495 [Candidatus Magasanikbacteria bacterium]|nr:hypothetical protein [Candidatus Magasanikbacteria bacterium]
MRATQHILISGLAVALGIVVWFVYFWQTAQREITPTLSLSPTSTVYENKILKIRFKYPTALFTLEEIKIGVEARAGVLLTSPYYVVENYKGTPDGEYKHPFKIIFSVKSGTIEQSLNSAKEEHPENAQDVDNLMQGKTDELRDFYDMKKVSYGGVLGYSYVTGIEGTNYLHVELQKNPKEILLVDVSYITDFLKDAIKPKPISEKEQLEAFDRVMKSLEFVK